jgi:hypothetical protein
LGEVVLNHPKMVNKWATKYISMYRNSGGETARSWAMEFLPAVPRQAMIEEVNRILGKKTKKGPEGAPDGESK